MSSTCCCCLEPSARAPGNAGKSPQPTKIDIVEAGNREDKKNDKRNEKSMLATLTKRTWQQGPLGSGKNG